MLLKRQAAIRQNSTFQPAPGSNLGIRVAPIHGMTVDERAQLVEDIRVSSTKRREIAERAQLDKNFDIAAAWEELEDLDSSIEKRVADSEHGPEEI